MKVKIKLRKYVSFYLYLDPKIYVRFTRFCRSRPISVCVLTSKIKRPIKIEIMPRFGYRGLWQWPTKCSAIPHSIGGRLNILESMDVPYWQFENLQCLSTLDNKDLLSDEKCYGCYFKMSNISFSWSKIEILNIYFEKVLSTLFAFYSHTLHILSCVRVLSVTLVGTWL